MRILNYSHQFLNCLLVTGMHTVTSVVRTKCLQSAEEYYMFISVHESLSSVGVNNGDTLKEYDFY